MVETIWLCVLCGFIGVFIGVVIMSVCAAAGRADLASALIYKDAQINTLCSRIALMEEALLGEEGQYTYPDGSAQYSSDLGRG